MSKIYLFIYLCDLGFSSCFCLWFVWLDERWFIFRELFGGKGGVGYEVGVGDLEIDNDGVDEFITRLSCISSDERLWDLSLDDDFDCSSFIKPKFLFRVGCDLPLRSFSSSNSYIWQSDKNSSFLFDSLPFFCLDGGKGGRGGNLGSLLFDDGDAEILRLASRELSCRLSPFLSLLLCSLISDVSDSDSFLLCLFSFFKSFLSI